VGVGVREEVGVGVGEEVGVGVRGEVGVGVGVGVGGEGVSFPDAPTRWDMAAGSCSAQPPYRAARL
jgi:hypothetical protein